MVLISTDIAKCDNAKNGCNNFTTNHDLSGSWCCPECFVQHEDPSQQRMTRTEYYQYAVRNKWDLDDNQVYEAWKLGVIKGLHHYSCEDCSWSSNQLSVPFTECTHCGSKNIMRAVTLEKEMKN